MADHQAKSNFNLANEAVFLGLATAVVYMMTSTYQYGFQSQYGLTYLSVGIEDITWTVRIFIVPTIVSVAGSILAAAIRVHLIPRPLTSIQSYFFIYLPIIAFLAAFFMINQNILKSVSWELYLLVGVYYSLDPILIGAITDRLGRASDKSSVTSHLRALQISAASLILIVFSYDCGRRDALNKEWYEVCVVKGETEFRVALHKVGDLAICAKANWEKEIIYADFGFIKIDADKPVVFKATIFRPQMIGIAPENPLPLKVE
ncbi:MAG TPA: hypothetical protein VEZ24_09765 [Microvirga sp.]|nr:hypothetical protein [Microvirga sp.]